MSETDVWLSWLIEGRQRGLDQAGLASMQSYLVRLRDRLLRLAKIQPGESVLDIGSGTGLIAMGARGHVGPAGHVMALDISHGALASWRARAQDPAHGPSIGQAVVDAHNLPLTSGQCDVVLARSVLMYLGDRPRAVQEILRVLRPGGRVVLFEPDNKAGFPYDHRWGLEPALFPAEHEAVREHMMAHWPHRKAILSLDQFELVELFREMGCAQIRASTLTSFRADRHIEEREARALLESETYPGRPSYDASARALLGERAESHLQLMVELLAAHPLTFSQSRILLQATTAAGPR